MKLKVCGMKYNTSQVAKLQPDYLGFIFYEDSPRNFKGDIVELPKSIQKVGVFVDASVADLVEKVSRYGFELIQLHGKETVEYIKELRTALIDSSEAELKIIKVFSIKDEFDFSVLQPYEDQVDYFLFDTKGKLPGGNGYTFNWDVLKNYPSTKPYFLSGGIGLNEIRKIKEFRESPASKYCYAIDVNSKFEIEPGLKNLDELEKLKYELQH